MKEIVGDRERERRLTSSAFEFRPLSLPVARSFGISAGYFHNNGKFSGDITVFFFSHNCPSCPGATEVCSCSYVSVSE